MFGHFRGQGGRELNIRRPANQQHSVVYAVREKAWRGTRLSGGWPFQHPRAAALSPLKQTGKFLFGTPSLRNTDQSVLLNSADQIH